jgi:hypothetical protein
MAVSSYGDATTTSGTVHIEKDLGISIEGKDVIIVEDIVDKGSLLHVYNICSDGGALLAWLPAAKPGNSNNRRSVRGFTIPNEFSSVSASITPKAIPIFRYSSFKSSDFGRHRSHAADLSAQRPTSGDSVQPSVWNVGRVHIILRSDGAHHSRFA